MKNEKSGESIDYEYEEIIDRYTLEVKLKNDIAKCKLTEKNLNTFFNLEFKKRLKEHDENIKKMNKKQKI